MLPAVATYSCKLFGPIWGRKSRQFKRRLQDAHGIERVLRFRRRVMEEFERLVLQLNPNKLKAVPRLGRQNIGEQTKNRIDGKPFPLC